MNDFEKEFEQFLENFSKFYGETKAGTLRDVIHLNFIHKQKVRKAIIRCEMLIDCSPFKKLLFEELGL